MGILDKLKFHALDSVGAVAGIIEKWAPTGCKTEKQYENSLYLVLHAELGDVQVTKQYAKGRIHADLVVDDKVIIELKHNLDSTAKFQRLVGQVESYKEWNGRVIILLTGTTEPNLRKQLDRHVETLNEGWIFLSGGKVNIVQK